MRSWSRFVKGTNLVSTGDDSEPGVDRDQYGARFDDHGDQYFNRMKPRPCDVKLHIWMVHHANKPHGWNSVEHDVLQVDDEVEHNYGNHHFKPIRKARIVEQSPCLLGGPGSQAHHSCRKHETKSAGVDYHDAGVGDPSRELRCPEGAARRALPQPQR